MKATTSSPPFQALFQRFANETRDIRDAFRESESAMEFEMVMLLLERLAQEFEWWEEWLGA